MCLYSEIYSNLQTNTTKKKWYDWSSFGGIPKLASTNILRYMVRVYAMVSFHQEKQKLAVGNEDGYVIIYEMRTASKWQSFQNHPGKSIDALAFSPNGEMLASYSSGDQCARMWMIEGGYVLNILGVANRAFKTFSLQQSRRLHPKEVVAYVKLEWESHKKMSLCYGKNLKSEFIL